MIKLLNILKECFYVSQWKDVLVKYPEFIELLKNDPYVKNQHSSKKDSLFGSKITDWNDIDGVAYHISYFGGHCGLDPKDFNIKNVKRFILSDMTSEGEPGFGITKNTAKKLADIIEQYFQSNLEFTYSPKEKEKKKEIIKKEYNRILNRLGKEKADQWLKWQK